MISQDIIQLINEINVNFTGDTKQDTQIVANLGRKVKSQTGEKAIIDQQNITKKLQSKNSQLKVGQFREAKQEANNSRLKILQKQTGMPNRPI